MLQSEEEKNRFCINIKIKRFRELFDDRSLLNNEDMYELHLDMMLHKME